MSEHSDLADWLRAVDTLQPASNGLVEAIGNLLGLRLKSAGKMQSASRRKTVAPQVKETGSLTEATQPIPESKPRRRIDSVLTQQNASRNPAPQWLAAAPHLDATDAAHLYPALPLEPLFPARTSRAILSGALATPSLSGPLHLAKIIESVSRGELVGFIPQLSIPTLTRGVQLLIDRGEGMQPFAADQAALREALVRVVGRDRTEVLYFEGSPLWGAGIGPKDEWPEYHTPTQGTPVVILTDLGIAQPPGAAGFAGTSDWRQFAHVLSRAGCPLLALVPYASARWPSVLSKCMTMLHWDRATTASVVRRAVPSGLKVAKET
jgi:hypothetical protein